MTMTETAGADAAAAAATRDTGHAAHRTIAIAGGPRVLESLEVVCTEEEEAGAVRTTGTGSGPGESPEGDLGRAPNLHLRGKPSTRRRPPITPRKKCGGRTPRPARGPGPHQDRALAHAPGPDPGPDASQEDARKVLCPPPLPLIRHSVRLTRFGRLSRKDLFVLT